MFVTCWWLDVRRLCWDDTTSADRVKPLLQKSLTAKMVPVAVDDLCKCRSARCADKVRGTLLGYCNTPKDAVKVAKSPRITQIFGRPSKGVGRAGTHGVRKKVSRSFARASGLSKSQRRLARLRKWSSLVYARRRRASRNSAAFSYCSFSTAFASCSFRVSPILCFSRMDNSIL